MLSPTIEDALNEQLNAEAYSGYLYLSMVAYFESIGLKGFAKWMGAQTREEFFHANKFYNYIIERSGRVSLKTIDAPPNQWESPLAAFAAAYEHERKVTGLINDLVGLAREEKDHASEIFLQWFVTEQVEEEASVEEVIQKLKLAGPQGAGLFMLDNELSQRVISPLVAAAMTGIPAPAA
ncbi:MAG: ferritin [Proteobacteria bacterium]|nr:ferritin [Pseudomonadota bacterium]